MLYAEGIQKQYLRKRKDSNVFEAVQETTLEVANGKITVIHGRSGSGKSTLLNMLSGILKPTRGRVLLGETDLYQLDDVRRALLRNEKFGVVPQGQSAIYSLNVLENVLLPFTMYEKRTKQSGDLQEVRRRAEALLSATGLQELRDVFPQELSGGELRRMAIARALMMKPEIVFADEPTEDLDDSNTKVVLKLFEDAAKNGCAVLIVTHDNSVFPYANVLLRMDDGKLKEEKDV